MPPGTRSARRARCSPTRRLSASLSSTHGPAMRNSASRRKSDGTSVRGFDERRRAAIASAAALAVYRRGDESGEERMRPGGPRLKLGVKLAADEPGMRRQLDDLDELTVGRQAAQLHAVLHEQVAVGIRDFISVAVPLAHFRLAVDLRGAGTASQPAGV